MYKELYENYQSGLKLYNAVDFDDLIVLPIKIFKEFPEVLEKYRSRYKYIMIDEFQDTSHQQYEFMHLLADKNVAVVGDDDQSIYSWRGADYQNIINFEKDFQGMKEIRLEQNYRSTETILAAANGVISTSKPMESATSSSIWQTTIATRLEANATNGSAPKRTSSSIAIARKSRSTRLPPMI